MQTSSDSMILEVLQGRLCCDGKDYFDNRVIEPLQGKDYALSRSWVSKKTNLAKKASLNCSLLSSLMALLFPLQHCLSNVSSFEEAAVKKASGRTEGNMSNYC